MLPAINITTLVSLLYRDLPLTLSSATASNSTTDIISPWGLFNITIPFTITLPLPIPLPFPLPIPLAIPLPIVGSLPFPGPFLAALGVLLTLTDVNFIAIARMAPCTALWSWISVTNRSKFTGQFRFRFHPKPDHGNGSYYMKNQAHWTCAGFTTKNPAFQHHNFASN